MLTRRAVGGQLIFAPWRLVALTVVWTLFSNGTTIRDNFLPVEWRGRLQPLDYLPGWPWWVWVVGVLVLTLVMMFEGAYRWVSELYRALYDRELPGRNADEIAPWRERGRTLTNQWRHLNQHGPIQYPRAREEAEEWRQDIRARLARKYGEWVANRFNETREDDSAGLQHLSPLAEHDARGERLAEIMYDVGTGRIHPRKRTRSNSSGRTTMPYWKLLMVIGLGSSFIGSLWLAWMAGVPWILPTRPRYRRDVVAWYVAVSLIPLGFLLQLIGTLWAP